MVAFAVLAPTLLHVAARVGAQPFDPTRHETLDQGWSPERRAAWYKLSQGSRLLPLSWTKALEQALGTETFWSNGNIEKYGYLPDQKSRDNPEGLPVGFVDDHDAQSWWCTTLSLWCANTRYAEPWVGLTCAACHTGQMTYRPEGSSIDRVIRIDGGPTLADFQGFIFDLLGALKATRQTPDKLERFTLAVLGPRPGAKARGDLQADLDGWISWHETLQTQNYAGTTIRYGFGRLDAQGHILNKIALMTGATQQPPTSPADAPASYPQIWDSPRHDLVQWNGIAPNKYELDFSGQVTNFGALVRNTGEATGVFGHASIERDAGLNGYVSSIRVGNLIDLERILGELKSPEWPQSILPRLNQQLIGPGRVLFDQNCGTCHKAQDRGDLTTPVKVEMRSLRDIGTDIWLACNTYLHRANAGKLEGGKTGYVVSSPREKPPTILANDVTRVMMLNIAIGEVVGGKGEIAAKIASDVRDYAFGAREHDFRDRAFIERRLPGILPGVTDQDKIAKAEVCLLASDDILKYKARPLNGIWATAPYLHNGSVPTLYDLLLPATLRNIQEAPGTGPPPGPTRPETFHVGSRRFDPKKVGYETAPAPGTFEFRAREPDGTPRPGNYNSGHDYGTGLTDDQRYQLIEYLKSL